jgi:AcrR family transcriptional regulator
MTPRTSTRQTKEPKTRDAEKSRAAILLAAREEFVAHGFSGARTGEIAKRAGVPQGLLYHYFDNKRALFSAVMNAALEPYFQATIDLLENPPEGPGRELLEAAIRMYFAFLTDNPHVARLMAWWVADQGWQEGPPIAKEELCANPMDLGKKRIQEGQEAGLIRKDLDPEHVIRMFLHVCMHWHMVWGAVAIEDELDPQDEAVVEKLHQTHLDHIVSMILNGVSPEA